jgi:dTDP-4-amino-4,6-dideoxygalactose transaminase
MSEKAALLGGDPAVPEHLVAHNWQRYRKSTEEEIESVVKVLESGLLGITAGEGLPQTAALEREFAEWVGCEYCLVVDSGTAALHCAAYAMDIGPGDEVIVPAYTFIASAMSILHCQAVPVFVDINPDTGLLDVTKIEEKINERTKAIAPVHVYGLPCDMDPINQLAEKYDLKVIEDAAQAYGARYKDRKVGVLGDAAAFSMSTTKHLMTGQGGFLTTNSEDVYNKAAMLRQYGEPGDLSVTCRGYQSEDIGWNYKLGEILAALARAKLRHLDEYISGIQELCESLTPMLRNITGLSTPCIPDGSEHSYYYYPVQVDPSALGLDIEPGKLRAAVLKALTAENVLATGWQTTPVPAQPIWHTKTGFGKKGEPWRSHGRDVSYAIDDYPETWRIIENHFILWHLTPPSTTELVECYAQAFRKVFESIDEVVDVFDRTEEYVPFDVRMKRRRDELA